MKIAYLKSSANLSEGYFQSVDDLKKTVDKRLSADDIRAQAKESILEENVNNVNLEKVFDVINRLFNYSSDVRMWGEHDADLSYGRNLPFLKTVNATSTKCFQTGEFEARFANYPYKYSEYSDSHLRDFITKDKTAVNILCKCNGRGPNTNPDSWNKETLNSDLITLREYLEKQFVGVPFNITVTIKIFLELEYDPFRTKTFTLAESKSDPNKIISDWIEEQNKYHEASYDKNQELPEDL